jgi:serine/threonine-protein kinase RsbW/stage II sporulation protein AB (anti-sigma F factor)
MAPIAVALTLPAVPASIPCAREAVRALADEAGADVQAVLLAVSEAATNAVLHAYLGRPAGPLHLRGVVRDGALVITVADEGRGMRPRPDSPGLGLGLPLLASSVDHLEVESPPAGGVIVQMHFPVPAAVRQPQAA